MANVSVPPRLHNLLTKVAIDRTVAACLLNFHKNDMGLYSLYRWERLVEKTMKNCTIILKSKLSRFTGQHQKTSPTMEKKKCNLSSKDMAEAHKNMDIAKERASTRGK